MTSPSTSPPLAIFVSITITIISTRYYGVNDPVAEKLLKRAQAMPHLEPPEDVNITTLYCGGLDENVTEADIKNAFYSFGELRNITLVPKQVVERVCI